MFLSVRNINLWCVLSLSYNIKMSDSEGSNFSDNESERGSNQQSDSDVEVTENVYLNTLPVRFVC